VYEPLGVDWDPAVTGAVAEEATGTGMDQVLAAIETAYAERYDLELATVDEETLGRARRLAAEHSVSQA
jgi:hypothetical protein